MFSIVINAMVVDLDICNTGDTHGPLGIGGLVGNNIGAVSYCYSTGKATGIEEVGGLCGYQGHDYNNSFMPNMSNCFWDTETSGQSIGYNLSTFNPGTVESVVGKTTTEMQTMNIYTIAGWDFENVWRICNGTNYPELAWQKIIAGDFNFDGKVDFIDYTVFAKQWMLERLPYDIDCDGIVNFQDFAWFASNWDGDITQLSELTSEWLELGEYNADIAPEPYGDGIVDILDLAMFAENWLTGK